MGTGYIPGPDAEFQIWCLNLSGVVNANPALYMMTAGQAASIKAVVDNFVDAFAVSSTEATRTKATIAAKDDARATCEALCRQYSMLIKDNTGISDPDKINAGIRPINTAREPVNCPQTSPLLSIIAATPGSQTVRYADQDTPDSKAKPFGASELQLFVAIAPELAPLDAAKFYGKFTRNPIAVEFSAGDNAKTATYYARWASVRGEVGPWSLPITMTIAA